MNTAATSRAGERWTAVIGGVAFLWIVLVLVVAVVQAVTYTGIIAAVSEWQFDHLGQSFPAMTFILLVALFALPGVLLLGYAIRRANALRAPSADQLVIQRSVRMLWVLATLAGLLAVAIVVILIRMAMLPGDSAPADRVEAGVTQQPALHEGAARLIGQYRYDRIATFRQNVLIAQREYRFVPVQPASGRPTPDVMLFAEIATIPDRRAPGTEERGGILRRGGLPAAVARLYQDAGFRLAPKVYVLYSDRGAMRWPYIAGAAQLAIMTVLLGIAALLTRRRLYVLRNGPVPPRAEPVPVEAPAV